MLEFFNSLILDPISNGVLEFRQGNLLAALMMMIVPTTIIMATTVGGSYLIHQFRYHFNWRALFENGRTRLNRLLSKLKGRRTIFEVRVITPGRTTYKAIHVPVERYPVLPVGSAVHLTDENGRNILCGGEIIDHIIYNQDDHGRKTLYVIIASDEIGAEGLIETSHAPKDIWGPMRYPRTIRL